jgi:potassium channel subfamily K, other eukaryote
LHNKARTHPLQILPRATASTSLPSRTSVGSTSWTKLATSIRAGEFLLQRQSQGMPAADGQEITRDTWIQSMQNSGRTIVDISAFHCIVAIGLYLGVAILAFSFVFDHWTVIDSMYFAVVTFTTIGYGDLTPDTTAGRIFTCFFALSGVAFLGMVLGLVGNNIINAQQKAVVHTSDLARFQVLTLFSSRHESDPPFALNLEGAPETTMLTNPNLSTSRPWSFSRSFSLLYDLTAAVVFALFFVVMVANDPGISTNWGDALYYAIITACTVGYGDYSPTSQLGRGLAIVFIPLSVGAMGHFLSIVANWIIEGRQKWSAFRIEPYDLTLNDLEAMDDDGDGNVTRADFLEFMLVAMNKADQSLIDELKDHFNRLDQNGSGSLSREDLIAVARRKLQSPTRKLELAAYKERLLQQASGASQR